MIEALLTQAVSFASSNPAIATALMVVGILRLINKPLFTILHSVVDATETVKDNEMLKDVEESQTYKNLTYLFDWLGSIKVRK